MAYIVTLLSLVIAFGITGLGIAPRVSVNSLFSRPTPTPTQPLSPTSTPTPRPLTFAEMNSLYGPCTYLPVPFWHHVQTMDKAKEEGHASLTVDTGTFRNQMQYVRDRGYTPIRPEQLIAFFDSGVPLPTKPILLTFDDGYDDFATDAAPIIRELGFQATVFIPTGLINNPGYLTWDTMNSLGNANFYFANHTWSHKNVNASRDVDEKEISTADTQLTNHGVNAAKVFGYPYGFSSPTAISLLNEHGYKLAFTTNPGAIQCKQQRFILPRTRIGGGSLSAYGL